MDLKENVKNLEIVPVHKAGTNNGQSYDYYKFVVKIMGVEVAVQPADQTGKQLFNAYYFKEEEAK